MPMKHPPHPGRSVKYDCLAPLGLSVTEASAILGVTRQALSNVVNEKSGISPEMAIRLSKAFGSTPEAWLRMQLAYDLAQTRKRVSKIKVRRYAPARSGAGSSRPGSRRRSPSRLDRAGREGR